MGATSPKALKWGSDLICAIWYEPKGPGMHWSDRGHGEHARRVQHLHRDRPHVHAYPTTLVHVHHLPNMDFLIFEAILQPYRESVREGERRKKSKDERVSE